MASGTRAQDRGTDGNITGRSREVGACLDISQDLELGSVTLDKEDPDHDELHRQCRGACAYAVVGGADRRR
jgi:hypothetical protein